MIFKKAGSLKLNHNQRKEQAKKNIQIISKQGSKFKLTAYNNIIFNINYILYDCLKKYTNLNNYIKYLIANVI